MNKDGNIIISEDQVNNNSSLLVEEIGKSVGFNNSYKMKFKIIFYVSSGPVQSTIAKARTKTLPQKVSSPAAP